MIDLNIAQQYMRTAGIDAWLLYDFRGSNPILWQVLGGKKHTTRALPAAHPARSEPLSSSSIPWMPISLPTPAFL